MPSTESNQGLVEMNHKGHTLTQYYIWVTIQIHKTTFSIIHGSGSHHYMAIPKNRSLIDADIWQQEGINLTIWQSY
jgi:hypothetical protein